MRGDLEFRAWSDYPWVVEIICVSDQSPLTGIVVFLPGKMAYCLPAAKNSQLTSIRRMLGRLFELFFNRFVFAESDVQFCA